MSHPRLAALQGGLDALRQGSGRPADCSLQARAQQALLDTLPPRYAEVLHGLLDPIPDLLDSLQLWLDKAAQHLANPA